MRTAEFQNSKWLTFFFLTKRLSSAGGGAGRAILGGRGARPGGGGGRIAFDVPLTGRGGSVPGMFGRGKPLAVGGAGGKAGALAAGALGLVEVDLFRSGGPVSEADEGRLAGTVGFSVAVFTADGGGPLEPFSTAVGDFPMDTGGVA